MYIVGAQASGEVMKKIMSWIFLALLSLVNLAFQVKLNPLLSYLPVFTCPSQGRDSSQPSSYQKGLLMGRLLENSHLFPQECQWLKGHLGCRSPDYTGHVKEGWILNSLDFDLMLTLILGAQLQDLWMVLGNPFHCTSWLREVLVILFDCVV